jgi:hypothetical protein
MLGTPDWRQLNFASAQGFFHEDALHSLNDINILIELFELLGRNLLMLDNFGPANLEGI